MQSAGAPKSHWRKALASLLGLLGPKDQELIKEALFDCQWPAPERLPVALAR